MHTPVLLNEVMTLLDPGGPECVFVDATLGEGGYAATILERFPGVVYIGIEVDPAILAVARERLSVFGERVRFHNMWFHEFFRDYAELYDKMPDRIIFDLGISRFHYDRSERGFSFGKDESLDMRLDPAAEVSAETLVNTAAEADLADIFFKYGEERYSRQIAAAIVRKRKDAEITRSLELAKIVERAVPNKYRYGSRIHPATRVFQALRIAVNHELDNLSQALESAFRVLVPEGIMGVISYHSLEDRIVKRFFNVKKSDCTCPPNWPICKCGGKRECEPLTKKPITPTEEEIAANRAARSAKFRVVRKLDGGGASE